MKNSGVGSYTKGFRTWSGFFMQLAWSGFLLDVALFFIPKKPEMFGKI